MKSILKRIFTKLTSIKTILILFSAVLLGFIVFGKLYEFKELAFGLLLLIAGYFGINVHQKNIMGKNIGDE